jgi:hypothetical protein
MMAERPARLAEADALFSDPALPDLDKNVG